MNEQLFAVKEYEDSEIGTYFDVLHVQSGYSMLKGNRVIEDKEFAQTYVDVLHENVGTGDIYQSANGEWGCKRGFSDDCGLYWEAAEYRLAFERAEKATTPDDCAANVQAAIRGQPE